MFFWRSLLPILIVLLIVTSAQARAKDSGAVYRLAFGISQEEAKALLGKAQGEHGLRWEYHLPEGRAILQWNSSKKLQSAEFLPSSEINIGEAIGPAARVTELREPAARDTSSPIRNFAEPATGRIWEMAPGARLLKYSVTPPWKSRELLRPLSDFLTRTRVGGAP